MTTKTQSIKKNQTGVTTTLTLSIAGPIPSLITRRVKTFHLFISEIEVEEKLKLENSFYINSLAVEKGDKVTVNFYNVDPVGQERHSFTIRDLYIVDIDIAFAENGNDTSTSNNQISNPYYCKYHQPVIAGQVLALPH